MNNSPKRKGLIMKKQDLIIFVLIIISLGFFGCATSPTPRVMPKNSDTFPVSKEKVWPLIIQEIGLNYPIKAIEKESGLITTDFVLFGPYDVKKYVYPSKNFLAIWSKLKMALNVMVLEIGPQETSVKIISHFEAYDNNFAKAWVSAQSNGTIENSILSKISWQVDLMEKN